MGKVRRSFKQLARQKQALMRSCLLKERQKEEEGGEDSFKAEAERDTLGRELWVESRCQSWTRGLKGNGRAKARVTLSLKRSKLRIRNVECRNRKNHSKRVTESETKFADTKAQSLLFPTFLKSDEPRGNNYNSNASQNPHSREYPSPVHTLHHSSTMKPRFTGRTHIGRLGNLPLVIQLVKFWIPACWLQSVLQNRVKERRTKRWWERLLSFRWASVFQGREAENWSQALWLPLCPESMLDQEYGPPFLISLTPKTGGWGNKSLS